jgi:hypothetical protein
VPVLESGGERRRSSHVEGSGEAGNEETGEMMVVARWLRFEISGESFHENTSEKRVVTCRLLAFILISCSLSKFRYHVKV